MCPANRVLCEITVVVPFPNPCEATGILNAFKDRHRRSYLKTPDLQYALEPTIASLCLPASLQIITPFRSFSIPADPSVTTSIQKTQNKRVQERSDPRLFLYHSLTVLSNVR
ncbi:hypothetical protein TcasGA2_TC014148 [Tribolium castaneum]|uniref:Uncharacterized protein n=1 Tax=Tribolium castaneum TaxID=7070 RepID=D6WKH8_TRICA|nr:hypothetical protein TcasGA2_TC014148 [Tribolium castaneum]